MNLEDKVMQALKDAMKAKDKNALRALRAVKTAIQLAKSEKGNGGTLSEDKELQILQKLVKQRKESAEIYKKENRADLAQVELQEIEVISPFLPKQLSEEEISKVIDTIINETGAESMRDMGKVMGIASKQLAGKADNKRMAELVKQRLSK